MSYFDRNLRCDAKPNEGWLSILPLCEQALDLPGCLEDNLQLERRAD